MVKTLMKDSAAGPRPIRTTGSRASARVSRSQRSMAAARMPPPRAMKSRRKRIGVQRKMGLIVIHCVAATHATSARKPPDVLTTAIKSSP